MSVWGPVHDASRELHDLFIEAARSEIAVTNPELATLYAAHPERHASFLSLWRNWSEESLVPISPKAFEAVEQAEAFRRRMCVRISDSYGRFFVPAL